MRVENIVNFIGNQIQERRIALSTGIAIAGIASHPFLNGGVDRAVARAGGFAAIHLTLEASDAILRRLKGDRSLSKNQDDQPVSLEERRLDEI